MKSRCGARSVHGAMSERAARGSLTGRWAPRAGRPNLRGAITIEQDLPAGSKLWLAGWTRTAAGCEEFGGPRKRGRRRAEDEGAHQDKLARLLGISQPQLANALAGRFGLSLDPAARLLAWLEKAS
jgi:hypothetical protein